MALLCFAVLTPCSRCVETTSWALWFPLFLFLRLKASSSHCLEPYLSTNACLRGCIFFFLALFSYGNDCDAESAVAFAGFWIAVRGLPRGRRISRQNQTALVHLDLILCGRGRLHLMLHEATKSTLTPSSATVKGGKFVSSLSLTRKPNGCKIACNMVPCSCRCGNTVRVFISPLLEVDHLQLRNPFPAALWRTRGFLGIVDCNYHTSRQPFPTGPLRSKWQLPLVWKHGWCVLHGHWLTTAHPSPSRFHLSQFKAELPQIKKTVTDWLV